MSKKSRTRKPASRRTEPAQALEGSRVLPMSAPRIDDAQLAPAAVDPTLTPADGATPGTMADTASATDLFADSGRAEPPVLGTPPLATQLADQPVDQPKSLTPDSVPEPAGPIDVSAGAEPSLAMRLRAAREARGMTVEQVARATHLPTATVVEIEAGRHEQLGPAVYVRGYLRSYARAVGLPEVIADLASISALGEPQLMPAAPMSAPTRRLATRLANPAIYAVMTLAVLVPLIYLARSQQDAAPAPALTALDGSVAELAMPLPSVERRAAAQVIVESSRPVANGVHAEGAVAEAGAGEAVAESASVDARRKPASDPSNPDAAPVGGPARPSDTATRDLPQPVLASIAPIGAPQQGARRLVLSLDEASWVEITGEDGRRIERALLPAGTVREYQLSGQTAVQIGNTRGARLNFDGSEVDLVPHTRANVARLVVGADGS